MSVGVRELKARLSHYLSRAAAGERIVITDRGRPYAELVPLSHGAAIERGIAEGWIEPAQGELAEPLLLPARRSTAEVLDEDRGD